MKRRHLLSCLAGAAVQGQTARAAPAQQGQAVLWPQVQLLGGGSFGPAQAAGRAVVVVFWTTTCPFCKRHNPHIEKLHRAAAGRNLVVLGVAREQDPALVQRYAQGQGYTFPITLDHQAMAAALSFRQVIPLTLTVDRQGRLQQALAGEMFEEDVLELLKWAA
jgi:thiol-disulfide isomerase/thioredoxin